MFAKAESILPEAQGCNKPAPSCVLVLHLQHNLVLICYIFFFQGELCLEYLLFMGRLST